MEILNNDYYVKSGVENSNLEVKGRVNDKIIRIIASVCLAVGGVLGIAGTFSPSEALRGLAWGIDGVALVVGSVLLTLYFFRLGKDFVASGFLIFAVGEGLVLSGAAMDLTASVPSFGAGISLWAAALFLISSSSIFPLLVRVLGFIACFLFVVTSVQIFLGETLLPTTSPLPFFAYPVLVATFFGWIWTLLMANIRFSVGNKATI